eukprot:Gb_04089 [translate_table: standard]
MLIAFVSKPLFSSSIDDDYIHLNSMTTRLLTSPVPTWFFTSSNFMKALQRNTSTPSFHSKPFLPAKQALSSVSRVNADLRVPQYHSEPVQNSNPTRPLNAEKILSSASTSDAGQKFREKLLYLEIMGVDSRKALTNNPAIRSMSLETMQTVVRFLEQMGMMQKDLGRIFGMCPQILSSNIDEDLVPVFNFLVDEVNIPEKDLRKTINKCPRLLVCSVKDQLRPTLYYLQKLGFVDEHSVTCSNTILLVSSVENTLIPKLEYLQSLGLSYKDAVSMVVRAPGLFTFSIANNFQPKFDYLVNEMGGCLDDLKEFPQYFAFSLEKRIKPRHEFLVKYNVSLPLSTMLKATDGEFWEILEKLHVGSSQQA